MSRFAKDLAALDRATRVARNPAPPPPPEALGLSYWIVRFMTDDGQIGSARRIAAKSAVQARAKHDRIYGGYVSNDPSFRVVVERDRSGVVPGQLHERNPHQRLAVAGWRVIEQVPSGAWRHAMDAGGFYKTREDAEQVAARLRDRYERLGHARAFDVEFVSDTGAARYCETCGLGLAHDQATETCPRCAGRSHT